MAHRRHATRSDYKSVGRFIDKQVYVAECHVSSTLASCVSNLSVAEGFCRVNDVGVQRRTTTPAIELESAGQSQLNDSMLCMLCKFILVEARS